MRIVFLDSDSIPCDQRRPSFPHHWQDFANTSDTEVVPRLADAQIAITNKVPLCADHLAQLPQLRCIAVPATGTNHLALDWCRDHHIHVANVPDYARHAVAEHALALMLCLSRNLLSYRQDVMAGAWQRSSRFCYFGSPIRDLHGQTLGLIGRGILGQQTALLAEALGMKILWSERKNMAHSQPARPGYTPFVEVLRRCDVLSLHCPLTADSHQLIGAAELSLMQPHALLINTSRGGLIDEAALAQALRSGRIGGAALDVLSQEPPPENHPLLAADLLQSPRFLLTPHVAWASNSAMQSVWDQTIANIEAFCQKHQEAQR